MSAIALSQMDTWDPKPDAISEHRSPFKPIGTKVPGMRFTELLRETARVADKLAVVRSMWHPKAGASGHGEGTPYMLSGAHPGSTIPMPDLGSVASHTLGTDAHFLAVHRERPAGVHRPRRRPDQSVDVNAAIVLMKSRGRHSL